MAWVALDDVETPAELRRRVEAVTLPQNFARNATQFQDIFHGPSFNQLTGARDALMNYPRVIDLPANRTRPVTVVGGGN